jgi:bilirubin oxidase
LPVQRLVGTPSVTRRLAILDERQGIIDQFGNPISLEFEDPTTENPKRGSTEIWEFYGFDSHPMHLHAGHFEIINRQAFGSTAVRLPRPWERGVKDTVDIHESGVTRVKVEFDDHVGKFVWHCHLLRHEDGGMMRPLELTA